MNSLLPAINSEEMYNQIMQIASICHLPVLILITQDKYTSPLKQLIIQFINLLLLNYVILPLRLIFFLVLQ